MVTVISFSNEEVCSSESHLREEDLTQDNIFSFAMKMCFLQCPTLGEEDLIQANKDGQGQNSPLLLNEEVFSSISH